MQAGVWLLLLAMLLTPAVDGVAKTLAADYDPMTIAFARYFAAGVIAVMVAQALRRPIQVPEGDRLGQVMRTALIMGAMTALIQALALVPMALAVGGFLIAPVVATVLSILILGEQLTPYKLAGSGLSFAGAVILLRPEAGIEVGSLFSLLGGVLLGLYLVAQRGAKSATDALSTLAVQCLLGAALIAPFAFAGGLPSFSQQLIVGAVALGAISAVCHALTVAAYRRAEASVLSPFLYFNLIAAMAVGFLWFGEVPTVLSVLGLGAIALGGLVTLIRGDARFLARLWPGDRRDS